MMRLKDIGHVLLRVRDLERSRAFYTKVLGFEVTEEDPEHGGTFMALAGEAHTLDLFQIPAAEVDVAAQQTPGVIGVRHVAFRVGDEAALRDAYDGLVEHGVKITRTIDHVSQKSIYFHDPDGNTLEIYYELPNARQMFRDGRQDRDQPFEFNR